VRATSKGMLLLALRSCSASLPLCVALLLVAAPLAGVSG
jgi:hypothetical protein